MILPNEYKKLLKITKPTLVMVSRNGGYSFKFRVVRPSGLTTWQSITQTTLQLLDGAIFSEEELASKNKAVFSKRSCFYKRRYTLLQLVREMESYDASEGDFITIIGEV